MKKSQFLVILALLLITVPAYAQREKSLKKILELKMAPEGGANGACVAWHTDLKKYYATMAGNPSFFLGVYDIKGKMLNTLEQQALFDVRGLWYNPESKTLQMNGYNEYGWGEYVLDKTGFPVDVNELHEDMNQPDAQSVGAFNVKEKEVLFFNEDGNIEKYDLKDGLYKENIELLLGKSEEDEDADNSEVLSNYNSTTAVYTGINGAEIGLLNFSSKQIELYSIKTGLLSRILSLPEDAPAPEFLNFAYCNGIYWLFDKPERIWKGYK